MAGVQELSQPTYRTRSVGDPYSARFLQKTLIYIFLFKEQITSPCETFQSRGMEESCRDHCTFHTNTHQLLPLGDFKAHKENCPFIPPE